MRIPTSFCLFGSKYIVTIKDDLLEVNGLEGQHSYRLRQIDLNKVSKTHCADAQEHAFLHELVHAILTQMSEGDLNGNEKFVDIFAGLLHQAINSADVEVI